MRIFYTNLETAPSYSHSMVIRNLEIDIIGPICPPLARGHRFILVIIDYFLKWAEAVPLTEVKTTNVVNFIKHHVIHQFGFLRQIIYENGLQFASQSFYQFGDKYQVQNIASTAYKPTANGLAEVFNKTIIKLLKKFISASKQDWNEKLSEYLWACQITIEPQLAICLFLWYTDVKKLYPWRFKYYHFVLLWQPR